MEKLSRLVLVLLLGAGLVLTGLPAVYGQEEADEEEKEVYTLEELVVTAEKREESIMEVPLTMSAFSGEMMEEMGMTTSEDLENLVPGLQMTGEAGTVIRGYGNKDVAGGSDPAVAVYVDGVYQFGGYGMSPNMFDMQRVEVMRGPQGTLHGRNAIGGSLQYWSKRPSDRWDVNVLLEFTDQFTQRYNVAFGGKIWGPFSFRLSGGLHRGDGSQENTGRGGDYGAPYQYDYKPRLRFKTDRLEINLSWAQMRDYDSPQQQVPISEMRRGDWENYPSYWLYEPAVPSVSNCSAPPPQRIWGFEKMAAGTNPNDKPYKSGTPCDEPLDKLIANQEGLADRRGDRISMNAEFRLLPSFRLRYTYGQGDTRTESSWDLDTTDRVGGWEGPLWFYEDMDMNNDGVLDDPDPGTWRTDRRYLTKDAGTRLWDYRQDAIGKNGWQSHELLLLSDFDGPLQFMAGVYLNNNYYHYNGRRQNFGNWLRFSSPGEYLEAYGIMHHLTVPPEDGGKVDPVTGASIPGLWNCEQVAKYFWVPVVNWSLDPSPTGFPLWTLGCVERDDFLTAFRYWGGGTTETRAVYGNLEWQVFDEIRVSGGVRYTEDSKEQTNAGWEWSDEWVGQNHVRQFGNNSAHPLANTWDGIIGNVAVEYTPEGQTVMLYGRVSTGYRAGGFQPTSRITNRGYGAIGDFVKEETSVNYELGAKGTFFDNRVELLFGAFYNDYNDFMFNGTAEVPREFISETESMPYMSYTANIEGTWVAGLDLEFIWYMGDNWRLSGFYSWADSEIGPLEVFIRGDWPYDERDYTYLKLIEVGNPSWTPQYVTEQIQKPRQVVGNQLPYQTSHKAALAVSWSVPLTLEPLGFKFGRDLGSVQMVSILSYTGDRWANIGNIPHQKAPAYTRWDMRATWRSQSERWGLGLWIQNITNKIGLRDFEPWMTEIVPAETAKPPIALLTEPRRIGFTLSYKMGW